MKLAFCVLVALCVVGAANGASLTSAVRLQDHVAQGTSKVTRTALAARIATADRRLKNDKCECASRVRLRAMRGLKRRDRESGGLGAETGRASVSVAVIMVLCVCVCVCVCV